MRLKTSLNFRNNFDGYKAVNQGKYHEEDVSCTKIRRTKQAHLKSCSVAMSQPHSPQIPFCEVAKQMSTIFNVAQKFENLSKSKNVRVEIHELAIVYATSPFPLQPVYRNHLK